MLKTCLTVAGFQELVSQILTQRFSDTRISMLLDGLIVFSTVSDPRNLPYFNNMFLLLHLFQTCGADPMKEMLSYITRSKKMAHVVAENIPAPNASFRIVTSRENKLVAVDNGILKRAEKHVTSAAGMRVDRSRPDTELWCLYRREGAGFFMMRLIKQATASKILHKGELRPQLASLLCALSEPHDSDVMVDPFCGYGSIPLARARLAPYRTIYAFDSDMEKIRHVRTKSRTIMKKPSARSFYVKKCDALCLNTLKDRSIDRIITDPPWGIFDGEAVTDIHNFYHNMLLECSRILKPGGIFVILTAQKELLVQCLQHFSGIFETVDTYDILVSGKKAGVYKMKKY
jgi:SAM-dependent methyltransferase